MWTPDHQKAFEEIIKSLLMAPALSLLDLTKSFTLYVDVSQGSPEESLLRLFDLGKCQWLTYARS